MRKDNVSSDIKMGFGPHLTLDLYGCNVKKLNNAGFICRLLDEFPGLIGMRKISKPHSVAHPPQDHTFDKGGVSAFVLIAESHIVIHTFVEQRHVFVDVFSCKDFDVKKAKDYFVRQFKARRVESNLFSRGKEFPKSIPVVEKIVSQERLELEGK